MNKTIVSGLIFLGFVQVLHAVPVLDSYELNDEVANGALDGWRLYKQGKTVCEYNGGVYADQKLEFGGNQFWTNGSYARYDRDQNGHHETVFLIVANELEYFGSIGSKGRFVHVSSKRQGYLNMSFEEFIGSYGEKIKRKQTVTVDAIGQNAEAKRVWKYPLEKGVSWEDAEEAMASTANELNMKNVGELPISEQVTIITGNKQRYFKIYQYGDPLTTMKMVNFSAEFASVLPHRIAMVEDMDGKFWLYVQNMDLIIHGGETLPEELLVEANRLQENILEIMQKGAAGDF